jgi:adenylate cyclase
MSGDPEQEYFSDGMTDTLITDLSRISSLFVIARHSVFTYKGKAVKVEEVSRELGVRYVLEGSVQKADNRVRINAQLVDATTGGHLWAERYDRELQDIFALQDEIVQQIIRTLKLRLTLWEQGDLVRGRTTDSLEAYDYLLRGLGYYFRFTKEANEQARQMYEKALELDPEYAEAYAVPGDVYWLEWAWQWSEDPQALERAFELERRAIALDDSLPAAHMILGQVYLWKKQHEQALAEQEKAITLDPNRAHSYTGLGQTLAFAGRAEEAIGMIKKGMRLNPHYPPYYLDELGRAYGLAGHYEEAIAAYKKVLIRDPDYSPTHLGLAITYSILGWEKETQAEAAEILRLNPGFSLEVDRQTWPYKDPAALERDIAALRKAGLK